MYEEVPKKIIPFHDSFIYFFIEIGYSFALFLLGYVYGLCGL